MVLSFNYNYFDFRAFFLKKDSVALWKFDSWHQCSRRVLSRTAFTENWIKKRGGLYFVCKILSWINVFMHFLYQFSGECSAAYCEWRLCNWSFERSCNWRGFSFAGWMCFMLGLCQKDLVWRNYLRFVQDSLRIVIGQYLKKRRMLFRKGILFSANVTNRTKWFFGTALNYLISCISCSC